MSDTNSANASANISVNPAISAGPLNKTADRLINLSKISREFGKIAALNSWQAYHTPKNLASAIAVEASELLAEFQWLTAEQSCALSLEQKQRVGSEVADVLMYLSELCNRLDIDMAVALDAKIDFNKRRFGAEL